MMICIKRYSTRCSTHDVKLLQQRRIKAADHDDDINDDAGWELRVKEDSSSMLRLKLEATLLIQEKNIALNSDMKKACS